jgi:predicted nucleotidyltransferase
MPGLQNQNLIDKLRTVLVDAEEVELAVLIGSQSSGLTSDSSDWDIAVRLVSRGDFIEDLDRMETVRRKCAFSLNVPETHIDLIDLKRARLAIRAVAAEEGLLIKGDGTLAWSHFLRRTWRELEEYYWEQTHAA